MEEYQGHKHSKQRRTRGTKLLKWHYFGFNTGGGLRVGAQGPPVIRWCRGGPPGVCAARPGGAVPRGAPKWCGGPLGPQFPSLESVQFVSRTWDFAGDGFVL